MRNGEAAVTERGAAGNNAPRYDGSGQAAPATRTVSNTRGIFFMLIAMAAFVSGDALMKLASASLPTGETLFIRGGVASALVWAAVLASAARRQVAHAFTRIMALRSGADVGGALLFQSALSRMPFADASAVLQINPLMVTAAAAVFLGEKVGWRRWTATAIGFMGALLIIRPGSSSFSWWSVVLIGAVMCATTRDLATRKIEAGIPALVITAVSVTAVMLASLLLLPFEQWVMPDTPTLLRLVAAGALMLAAQLCVVISIRSSDISAVVPFRYSAILWSIGLGVIIWGEFPDRLTLMGIAIVAAAGLYAFFREQKLKRLAVSK